MCSVCVYLDFVCAHTYTHARTCVWLWVCVRVRVLLGITGVYVRILLIILLLYLHMCVFTRTLCATISLDFFFLSSHLFRLLNCVPFYTHMHFIHFTIKVSNSRSEGKRKIKISEITSWHKNYTSKQRDFVAHRDSCAYLCVCENIVTDSNLKKQQ